MKKALSIAAILFLVIGIAGFLFAEQMQKSSSPAGMMGKDTGLQQMDPQMMQKEMMEMMKQCQKMMGMMGGMGKEAKPETTK